MIFFMKLLPFYGTARLRDQIPLDAVEAFDLTGNTLHKTTHQRVIDLRNLYCHGIHAVDSADDNWPVKSALAIGDSSGPDVRDDSKILLDFAFQSTFCKFLPAG